MRNPDSKPLRVFLCVMVALACAVALGGFLISVASDNAVAQTQPEPVCVYTFWVSGDDRAYCATQMVVPPVPSHVCFIEGPSGDEVCLPLDCLISRRSL